MKKTISAVLAIIFMIPFICLPENAADSAEYDFHTEEQLAYILESKEDLTAVFKYAEGAVEKSVPDPVVLDFRKDGIADSEEYVFQMSPTPDFADCKTVTGLVFKEYEYYNAFLGEHFYWRGGSDPDTIDESPVHEATVTSLCPRVCYVPGGTNVRDVGGYGSSLVPGGKIRQGLYYRGAELNNVKTDGIAVLYNDLGVRAEIDLRDADGGRKYVKGIEKIAYYNAPMSGLPWFDNFPEQFKLVFEVIANAANAPVYLHCQAGADRTGICSFMLLTVCGVSYQDAALDYMFTNFSVMGKRVPGTVEGYYRQLDDFRGETKAEQAKNWIMSKGVSEYTVEVIRETFVEGYESEYLRSLSAEYDFHTDEQKAFILESFNGFDGVYQYADDEKEMSFPDPVVLDFRKDGISNSDEYFVQISESRDFSECRTISDVPFKEYEYFNAFLGEHFFWRAGSDLETIGQSPIHEATVAAQGPRNLYVPGLSNVRDVGGYESSLVPGGKIRQGICYRGGGINDLKNEGSSVLANDLGVRVEIDMTGRSRPGGYRRGIEKIRYHTALLGLKGWDFINDDYGDEFRRIFGLISDADNNPVYFHCAAGADRTGFVSCILLTVCGVNYHDVTLDYVFTGMSIYGKRYHSVIDGYYEQLNAYPGETKAAQAKSWLISKGVSEATVEKIREAFVEGYESEYLKEHPFNPGDVNADGKLNARDVAAMMKFLVHSAPQTFEVCASDVNGDVTINAKDVTALMEYLVSAK